MAERDKHRPSVVIEGRRLGQGAPVVVDNVYVDGVEWLCTKVAYIFEAGAPARVDLSLFPAHVDLRIADLFGRKQ